MRYTRKELHPFWLWWFVAVVALPMGVGASVWLCGFKEGAQWYDTAAVLYNIIHGIGLYFSGLYGSSSHGGDYPLMRERPATPKEAAEDELREEMDKLP